MIIKLNHLQFHHLKFVFKLVNNFNINNIKRYNVICKKVKNRVKNINHVVK